MGTDELETISSAITKLTSLTKLKFSDCGNFDELLIPALKELRNLRSLKLSGKLSNEFLKALTASLCHASHLRVLSLEDLYIKDDEGFGLSQLTALTKLDLTNYGNNVRSISPELAALSNLEVLVLKSEHNDNFTSTDIEDLALTFSKLRKLRKLNISSTRLVRKA